MRIIDFLCQSSHDLSVSQRQVERAACAVMELLVADARHPAAVALLRHLPGLRVFLTADPGRAARPMVFPTRAARVAAVERQGFHPATAARFVERFEEFLVARVGRDVFDAVTDPAVATPTPRGAQREQLQTAD